MEISFTPSFGRCVALASVGYKTTPPRNALVLKSNVRFKNLLNLLDVILLWCIFTVTFYSVL